MESDQALLLKWINRFWYLLLLPWIIIAPLSAVAFISGNKLAAYIIVGCVWSYPVVVGISVLLKRPRQRNLWVIDTPR